MRFSDLKSKPWSIRPKRLLGCIGLALWFYAIPSHAAPKQATPRQTNPPKKTRSPRSSRILQTLEKLFVPPKGNAPKSTANSATRDRLKCAPDEATIQAILPPQGYGLTASDRPAIALNLPPTSAQQVALVFSDEAGIVEHKAWLTIPDSTTQSADKQLTAGEPQLHLAQFKLPANRPGLLPGKLYRWSLVVVCGENIEPDDPTFMGWVEYRAPTPADQMGLQNLSAEEKRRWYGEQGYWYDMLPN